MTQVTEEAVALMPCPFCGGEASDTGHIRYGRPLTDVEWADGSPITEAFFVNCVSCGIANGRPGLVGGYQTKAEAVALWNTRLAMQSAQPAEPSAGVEWETFSDVAYYDMWCVRPKGERRFGHGFHLVNGDEAKGLVELLNTATLSSPPPVTDEVEKLRGLPPSLAVSPNIPWERQTLKQLEAERDYWAEQVRTAPGFTSAKAADDFRKSCEAWIARHEARTALKGHSHDRG